MATDSFVGAGLRPSPYEQVREEQIWLRSGADSAQRDLKQILLAVGLGDHARPCSPHDVVQNELLPRLAQLRAELEAAREALQGVIEYADGIQRCGTDCKECSRSVDRILSISRKALAAAPAEPSSLRQRLDSIDWEALIDKGDDPPSCPHGVMAGNCPACNPPAASKEKS